MDSNFNFDVIDDFFKRFIQHYFEDMTVYDTFANKHPIVRDIPSFPTHVTWSLPETEVTASS